MASLVQIRDLPDDVHRTLKSRAAAQGVSLSEYLRGLLAAGRSSPDAGGAVRSRAGAGRGLAGRAQ